MEFNFFRTGDKITSQHAPPRKGLRSGANDNNMLLPDGELEKFHTTRSRTLIGPDIRFGSADIPRGVQHVR